MLVFQEKKKRERETPQRLDFSIYVYQREFLTDLKKKKNLDLRFRNGFVFIQFINVKLR